jgi:hypothetical protein
MQLKLRSPSWWPSILPPSLFSNPEMSFHLPIYANAMAHASITDLATWDEDFIDSCPLSSGPIFVLGRISLD